ncbi:ATP-grasp domain-containing protein [Streptomyces sp. NPDC040724]|uniref:ATP-grasp domain-containing protein n=1 Tax=Streptomyces sp. NPDC040724 TaxID=3155612 RepID=UPI0033CB19D6
MFSLQRAHANGDRYLLLLGADLMLRERAIVSALRAYPGPVIGMTEDPISGANRYFDHVLPASSYKAKPALKAVEEFERQTGLKPDAVVPIYEMNLHASVAIAHHYGLPALSDEALRRSRDKHTMKVAFEEAGVPCARHRLFSTAEELRAIAAELEFPLVLKPRDFAGSVGIIRVNAADELDDAYEHCRSSLMEVAGTFDLTDGRFQAEEFFVSTHEVSVEVINYEGSRAVLAVTDKSKSAPPYFAETGQLVPSRETDNAALREIALKACEALHIDRGIAHVEILVNGDELSVVEVGARPGGDGIMDLIDRVYGFSPYDLHIAAYRRTIEQLPPIPDMPRGIAATGFLKAAGGTITGVHQPQGFDPVERALYVTAKPGDHSRPPTSYLGREGVIECFERGRGPGDSQEFQARVAELAAAHSQTLFSVEP